jgi:hypothetical protein
VTRLQTTVVQLDEDMVRVLDEVAAGLGVSRSHVVRRYLEEPLRARCLWPRPPGAHPASPDNDSTVHPHNATAAAGLSSTSEQGAPISAPACEPDAHSPKAPPQAGAVPRARRKHPWNERVDVTREQPSLRSRHGAGR